MLISQHDLKKLSHSLSLAHGRMRRVLDDATAEEFAWSPDGRRVVYHARRNGAWSLWQLALDPAA